MDEMQNVFVFAMQISEQVSLSYDRGSKLFSMQFSKHALLDHDRGSDHVLHAVLQIRTPRSWSRIETCSPCGSPNTHSLTTIEDKNVFYKRFSKHVLLNHDQESEHVFHAVLQTRTSWLWPRIKTSTCPTNYLPNNFSLFIAKWSNISEWFFEIQVEHRTHQ